VTTLDIRESGMFWTQLFLQIENRILLLAIDPTSKTY
jgi:hypothetical protein